MKNANMNNANIKNESTYFERYNDMTHVLGRIFTTIVLVMLVGAPFLIGKILGAMPDLKATAKGFLSVGIIWTVSSIVEFLVYTPMLGAGGSYLAFITGNLINMKIPCAVNARDTVGAKSGTPEKRDNLHSLNSYVFACHCVGSGSWSTAAATASAGSSEPGAPACIRKCRGGFVWSHGLQVL